MKLSITADKFGNPLWNQLFINDVVYGFKNNDLWEGNTLKLYDKLYELEFDNYRDGISYDVFSYNLIEIEESVIVDVTYVVEENMLD